MSLSRTDRPEMRPLVVVLCSVPLLAEAISGALDAIAEVRSFSDTGDDHVGLLRSLQPDAVVVDNERDAVAAAVVAAERNVPAFHVSVRDATLRAYGAGGWYVVAAGKEPTPEAIRNAIAGSLYAGVSR